MRKTSKKPKFCLIGLAMISTLLSASAGYGLSPQVKYKWTKNLGGSPRDVTTDPSGNIYITGGSSGTADFGSDFGTTDIKISADPGPGR